MEIDSRKGRAEAQFLGRVDLPEIFRAEAVEVIREGLVAAERENVVAVSGSIKQFVCVRLVGAPIDHHAVLAGFIEREGHVAVEFAGLERAAIETELALGRAVRLLELDVHNAEAAVRAEVQRLAASVDFDAFDDPRIDRGGRPEVFARGGAVEIGHAVNEQQGVAVRATIDTDGEFAFVRRVADIGAADQAGSKFAEVGEAAGQDFIVADQLHLVAKLSEFDRQRACNHVDDLAFNTYRLKAPCIIILGLRLCEEWRQRRRRQQDAETCAK